MELVKGGGPQRPPQVNVDLKTSTSINHENGVVFCQGVVLRRISKFLTGNDNDMVLPIPVFYDPISNKILRETVPQELHEEYEEYFI
jgi:hypothetical protein